MKNLQSSACPSGCASCRLPLQSLCRGAAGCVDDLFGASSTDCRVPAGTCIGEAGRVSTDLYIVRSGVLHLEQMAHDSERRIVGLVGVGGTVGLDALFGRPLAARAVAWTDLALCRVPVAALRERLPHSTGLSTAVMEAMQDALSGSYDWTVGTSCGPLRTRLMWLLLRLVALFGGPRVCLPTREDLGAMLGVTTESASRAVSQLRRMGLLRSCGGSTEYIVRVGAVHLALDPTPPARADAPPLPGRALHPFPVPLTLS